MDDDHSQEMLAALRADFDRAFTLPLAAPSDDGVDVIGLRVGAERLAFRLQDLAGLQALGQVVPLPGAARGLSGLMGLRGRAVAVYDLATLLGLVGGASAWIALCRFQEPLALAFEALEGYWRVPRDAFAPSSQRQDLYSQELVRVAGHSYAVLETAALEKAIARLAGVA
ncbi:CheW-like domain protein [compost metagenome]